MLSCPVCFESKEINNCGACVPCGHLFCLTCLAKLTLCPTCRGKVERVQKLYGDGDGDVAAKSPLLSRSTVTRDIRTINDLCNRKKRLVAAKSPLLSRSTVTRDIRTINDLCNRKTRLEEVVQFWSEFTQLGQLVFFSVVLILILVVCWDLKNPNGVLFGLVVPIMHLFVYYPVSRVLFVLWYIVSHVAFALGYIASTVGFVLWYIGSKVYFVLWYIGSKVYFLLGYIGSFLSSFLNPIFSFISSAVCMIGNALWYILVSLLVASAYVGLVVVPLAVLFPGVRDTLCSWASKLVQLILA